jgi:LPXTG-motif cell wall-anchored protein
VSTTSGAARPAATPKTLPFTGVDPGPLVLMGALLLGSGLLLRRRLAL